jgi:hypothetical protein
MVGWGLASLRKSRNSIIMCLAYIIRSQKGFFANVFVSELYALEQNPKLRPKASLHKGGGLRPPHKGKGRSAARPLRGDPLWRLAFVVSLNFSSKAYNFPKTLCTKPLLRPYEYRVLTLIWYSNRSCVGGSCWFHGVASLENKQVCCSSTTSKNKSKSYNF